MTRTVTSRRPAAKGMAKALRNLTGVGLLLTLGLAVQPAAGQSTSGQPAKPPLRVGILTDVQSAYADLTGRGSKVAAELAIEDYGGTVAGRKIELLFGDHQNKPDVGVTLAMQWLDNENVAAIFDLPTSSVAMSVQSLAKDRPNRTIILTGGFASDLVGKACQPNSLQVVPNTYALANTVSSSLVKNGFDKWFYLTVDNLGGAAMQTDSSRSVQRGGGTVLGSVKTPLNAADMSSFVLQAQAANPKVLGLAMGGNDTINAMKTAREFGMLEKGLQLATYSFDVTDVHGVGVGTAQGTYVASSFYWDKNDETRAWAKRFLERFGKMPTQYQASMYVGMIHYLRSVEAAGGADDATVVVPKMKEIKVRDFGSESGYVREDGSFMRELMLNQVKTPAESKGPWDYFRILRKVPAEEAYIPLKDSECPHVKKG